MAYMAARSASGQGRSKRLSYVKPEYLKGHMFPGLDWQTSGYLSGVLWNTKNHIIRIIPGYDPETREVFRQNINVTDYSQEEDQRMEDYLREKEEELAGSPIGG